MLCVFARVYCLWMVTNLVHRDGEGRCPLHRPRVSEAHAIAYENMVKAGMMYQDPPEFAEIIEAIQHIETEINSW